MTEIAEISILWLMFFITLLVYFSTLFTLTVYTQFLSDPHPWYGFESVAIMFVALLLLTAVYFFFLKNPPKKLWLIIIFSALVTFPAFPAAFSRDVYNYAMDAKTLVVYRQNPWTTPPKAHPNDELLTHIHWPNDPSRYGPVWILPSSAIYSAWPSLYAFKLFTVISFLLCLVLVEKLGGKNALVFLAFNPLMIIEYFLGTHTDITMTLFILLALYFLFQKRAKLTWLFFLFSVGTKITSLPLIVPIWLSRTFHLSLKSSVLILIWFAYLGSLIIIAKWSINPWYFTLPIVLTALYLSSRFHKFLAISLSLAAAVRYLPILYLGPFDPHNKIRAFLFLIFLVPFVISLFLPGKSSSRLSR